MNQRIYAFVFCEFNGNTEILNKLNIQIDRSTISYLEEELKETDPERYYILENIYKTNMKLFIPNDYKKSPEIINHITSSGKYKLITQIKCVEETKYIFQHISYDIIDERI